MNESLLKGGFALSVLMTSQGVNTSKCHDACSMWTVIIITKPLHVYLFLSTFSVCICKIGLTNSNRGLLVMHISNLWYLANILRFVLNGN